MIGCHKSGKNSHKTLELSLLYIITSFCFHPPNHPSPPGRGDICKYRISSKLLKAIILKRWLYTKKAKHKMSVCIYGGITLQWQFSLSLFPAFCPYTWTHVCLICNLMYIFTWICLFVCVCFYMHKWKNVCVCVSKRDMA